MPSDRLASQRSERFAIPFVGRHPQWNRLFGLPVPGEFKCQGQGRKRLPGACVVGRIAAARFFKKQEKDTDGIEQPLWRTRWPAPAPEEYERVHPPVLLVFHQVAGGQALRQESDAEGRPAACLRPHRLTAPGRGPAAHLAAPSAQNAHGPACGSPAQREGGTSSM
ncbi:hypothetical protein ABZX75_25255 [Streptomyces sp. NPDC003038]|uniref:hypothetical protein n=1 Tax=unclassified Streptomyces TaxID=2593676 RepID=UPI0033B02D50